MNIMEIVGWSLSLFGIAFILWMAVRTTVRALKQKGILQQRNFRLKFPWKKDDE